MTLKRLEDHYRKLRHEDPLSNEAGAFPVGTGVGAMLGGAAAGAAAGAVAGPVGALVGTIAGGVVGGFTGKIVAEYVDPTIEIDYSRAHRAEECGDESNDSAAHASADRAGWFTYDPGLAFDEREEVERRWIDAKGLAGRNAIGRHFATTLDYADE